MARALPRPDVAVPARAPRRRVTGDSGDLYRYEAALSRAGFRAIAGVDEAGRGACAGPLVVASVLLRTRASGRPFEIEELGDSKVLTAAARERVYERVTASALSWTAVVISPGDVDRIGLHVANIEGMRRALARLSVAPDYVLSDGFSVPGLTAPNLGIWKGDRVASSVAAAGVVAKVTRDRIMTKLHDEYPQYGFDVHKGYVTASHREALAKHGPAPVHRYCFEPVRRAAQRTGAPSR